MLLAGAAALAGCGSSRPADDGRVPAPPSKPPEPGPNAAPGPSVRTARFDFHIGAWLALHHIFYELGVKKSGPDAWFGPGIEAVDGSTLPPKEAAIWSAAVEAYRVALADKDPVFDHDVGALHDELGAAGSQPTLGGIALPGDLRTHLERAMPIYRRRWWTEHEHASNAWLRSVRELLAQHETDMASELAALLHQAWPAEPMPVDLCPYANWAGAYSTLGPVHLYVATLDSRNQGPEGLEVIFHETSHVLIRTVRDAIDAAARKRGKQTRDLWHVLLFVTAGEVVRRRFPGYVPYGEKEGLYAKGPWKAAREAVERGWRPYLDGKRDFDAAVQATVEALPG